MTTPHTEGHYWAKQIRSDNPETCLSNAWEVVQTFDNGGDTFELRVFVPGQEASEAMSSFIWGPRVIAPKGCES
jgi:hypothetical protein